MSANPIYDQYYDDLQSVMWFVAESPIHSKWSYNDIINLIVPPLQLGQYIINWQDGIPVGFASWAWLSDEAHEGFKTQTRKLIASDWCGGNHAWIIDVISNDHSPIKLLRGLRDMFINKTDAQECHWMREYVDGTKVIKEMIR